MRVEERLEAVGDTLHLYFRPHQIAENIANAKFMAAVRELVLEVHDEACSICYQQTAFGREACEKRARLEALPAEKEGEG